MQGQIVQCQIVQGQIIWGPIVQGRSYLYLFLPDLLYSQISHKRKSVSKRPEAEIRTINSKFNLLIIAEIMIVNWQHLFLSIFKALHFKGINFF